ncbi:MAG: hypothetical protein QOK29_1497 [Rhodospirillaceae bacterium]|nr:hypothetical protein [Rhodospirillaceae bacterium]
MIGDGADRKSARGPQRLRHEVMTPSTRLLPRLRRALWPLYARLAVLLGALLLPMVAYSLMAAYATYQEGRRQTQQTVTQLGEIAASRSQSLIDSTRRLLLALAETEIVRTSGNGTTDNCSQKLRRLVGTFEEYSSFALTDADGRVVCSSTPSAVGVSVADRMWWQQARASRHVTVSNLIQSKLTNAPAVVVAMPLGGLDRPFLGTVSATINVVWLAGLTRDQRLPERAVVFLLDRSGVVLSRTGELVKFTETGSSASAANPELTGFPSPEVLASALAKNPPRFTGEGSDGVERLYSAMPLAGTDLLVLFGVPESSSFSGAQRAFIRGILSPLGMLVWALIGVAFIGDFIVARDLRALSKTARALRRGDYTARPKIKGWSREIGELAETLTEMAQRVQRHEEDLSRSLQQKDAMLREVHHRVKNNLQVVTSLMSLQASRLRDPGSKQALTELQRRVRALGLLHRHLYEGDDVSHLNFGQFVSELCKMAQVSAAPGSHVTIEAEIPPLPITPDRAVPLALLITEALSNALKHAFPAGEPGHVRIRLTALTESTATLSIADNGTGLPASDAGEANDATAARGTGMVLMQAFARQLGGTLFVEGPPGTTVSVSFRLDKSDTPSSDAEGM